MSKSLNKPVFASRKYLRAIKRSTCKLKLCRRRFILKFKRVFRKFRSYSYKIYKYYFRRFRLRGKFKRRILIPKRNDSILRITSRFKVWQNFRYYIKNQKNSWEIKRRKKKYTPSRYMSLQKYGSFLRTRSYGGFRCKKDQKKIEKLKKDMLKAARKRVHNMKESARLMKKAIFETEAARLKKLGKKMPTKKKKKQ